MQADGARGQRIGADRLEPSTDNRLLDEERNRQKRREREEDRVRNAQSLPAGNLRQQRRRDTRHTARHSEDGAIEQSVHADGRDDRVEFDEANKDAVRQTGGQGATHCEQNRGQKPCVIPVGIMGGYHNGE